LHSLSFDEYEVNERFDDWDQRHLQHAQYISTYSKDPSTKVGAIITNGKRIVSVGYNGFPQRVLDSPERLKDREVKYKMVVHGEVNAMHFAECSIQGFTLYTYPFMPCSVCAGQVIQRGIRRVVAPFNDNERWAESFVLTRAMFKEAGVQLVEALVKDSGSALPPPNQSDR
jgi:dCMP deaminase